MKKYSTVLAIVIILVVGYIIQAFTPWWSLALIAGMAVILFQLRPSKSIWVGFLAGFLLWGAAALLQNMANQGILAQRIGSMLGGLPGGVVPFLSALIGGLTAGLGALLASLGIGLFRSS